MFGLLREPALEELKDRLQGKMQDQYLSFECFSLGEPSKKKKFDICQNTHKIVPLKITF